MPWAKGMLSGLGSDVTPGEIALAAYEGVVMGLECGARIMRDFGVQIDKRIIATGGGAQSEAYRQVIADFSGLPVHTVDAAEATARGAAVQAAAIAREVTVEAVTAEWSPAPVTENTPQERAQEEVFQRYLHLSNVQAHSNPY
jgi:xylulokinase